MSPLNLTEPSSTWQALARLALRRRRPTVEDQPARCPLCDRVMTAYMARHGPAFLCGCNEPKVDVEEEG